MIFSVINQENATAIVETLRDFFTHDPMLMLEFGADGRRNMIEIICTSMYIQNIRRKFHDINRFNTCLPKHIKNHSHSTTKSSHNDYTSRYHCIYIAPTAILMAHNKTTQRYLAFKTKSVTWSSVGASQRMGAAMLPTSVVWLTLS